MAALTDERFGSSAASTMVPEMPVNCPLTLDSIMCRTLNWARLWRGSMCHADQLCAVGAVFASATLDMWMSLWMSAARGQAPPFWRDDCNRKELSVKLIARAITR